MHVVASRTNGKILLKNMENFWNLFKKRNTLLIFPKLYLFDVIYIYREREMKRFILKRYGNLFSFKKKKKREKRNTCIPFEFRSKMDDTRGECLLGGEITKPISTR